MKSRFIYAIALQSSGPLLLLGLSVAISRFLGPKEQGAFISVKSWLDVLVAAGCFGFPQSAVIAINRYKASRRRLYLIACLYSIAIFPLLAIVSHVAGGDTTPNAFLAIMLAFGAACMVLVNIWRGILLTIDDGLRFHAITALPSVLLVCVVAIAVAAHRSLSITMPYVGAFSGLLALGFGYILFPWGLVRETKGKEPVFLQLVTNGADVFVQALTTALQAYLCFTWLKHMDGLSSAGYFSVALMIMNAFGFPLQAISPIILNRWSQEGDDHALHAGSNGMTFFVGCLVVTLALCIALAPWLTPIGFGESFGKAIPAVQIMLLGVLPMAIIRVGSLRLASLGQFRFNSAVAAGRCVLLLALLYPVAQLMGKLNAATVASTCWVISEISAALITHRKINQLRRNVIPPTVI